MSKPRPPRPVRPEVASALVAAALAPIVDRHEAAELLGISPQRLDVLAAQGRLTPTKRWGRVLYLRQEVEHVAAQPRLPGAPGHRPEAD